MSLSRLVLIFTMILLRRRTDTGCVWVCLGLRGARWQLVRQCVCVPSVFSVCGCVSVLVSGFGLAAQWCPEQPCRDTGRRGTSDVMCRWGGGEVTASLDCLQLQPPPRLTSSTLIHTSPLTRITLNPFSGSSDRGVKLIAWISFASIFWLSLQTPCGNRPK